MKGFEDAFTDLQAEFVSLCMEYTNSNFDTYNSLTPNWYYKVLR